MDNMDLILVTLIGILLIGVTYIVYVVNRDDNDKHNRKM